MSYDRKMKVLFVNCVLIGAQNATGITLKNIFRPIEDIEIFQLCMSKDKTSESHNTDIIHINAHNIPVDFWVRLILRKIRYFKNHVGKIDILPYTIVNRGVKNIVHDFLRGVLDLSPFILDENILSCIEKFDPDLIYTLGGNIRILKVVNKLSIRLNVPIVLHLMDNWPETIYTTSWLSAVARFYLLEQLKFLHTRARFCFAISKEMANVYQERYGVKYDHIMNCVSIIEQEPYNQKQVVVNFLYIGGLHLNRWKSLIDVLLCINKLCSEGVMAEVNVYTQIEYIEQLKNIITTDGINVFQHVPHSETFSLYKKADVLIHVESFEENIIKFTKYSISTKIVEYMAAGRAILCYAPKELTVSQYITESNSGLVASNKDELRYCILELILNSSKRSNLAENGRLWADCNHHQDMIVAKMRNMLKDISNSNLKIQDT